MSDLEDSSDPGAILLGPGARPALLVPLLRALMPAPGPSVRQLADLGALLSEATPGGFLLLDADEVPLEDLGLVRRFLEGASGASWVLLLTGDDPAAPVARRLLARASAATWLPWPVDVEELQALARGASPAELPAEFTVGPSLERSPGSSRPSDAPPEDRAVTSGPAGEAAPLQSELRDDLERRLGRELTAIESILRDEEGLLHDPAASPGSEAEEFPEERGASSSDLAGLELSREEIEAFLGPLDVPLEGDERAAVPQSGPQQDTQEESPEGPPEAEALRAQSTHEPPPTTNDLEGRQLLELPPTTEARPEVSPEAPDEVSPEAPDEASDDDGAPPVWYRAQVADLADLAQGLGMSLHALREANEEEGEDAVYLRDEATERLGGDVMRLIQFTRTLGFLAAPPGPGQHRLALATLVEEQLGGLAGSGPDSPRFLFRADDEIEVRCDKPLVVQALDALLHVADACAEATDVVRVGVHDGDAFARIRIDFPAGPAAKIAPSRALQPYGLRRQLPTIGPNALAAASRLIEGQGGRLSLGRGGPGRLVFEADLPKG